MTELAAGRPRHTIFRRAAAILAAAATTLLAACETLGLGTEPMPPPPEIGLYELRIYTAAEGKLDDLDTRFRHHEVRLFRKHGMTPVGFFHVASPPGQPEANKLYYIMGYKDRSSRDESWRAFAADPEWQRVYRESEADGPLFAEQPENVLLTATDYSPKLDLRNQAAPRLFELRTYTVNPGRLEDLHTRFRDHTLRIFEKHGMTNVLYWRPEGNQPGWENKMMYLLAFPDLDSRATSFRNFSADPEWQKVAADSQRTGPILISPGGVVSVQLKPTDYSPLR